MVEEVVFEPKRMYLADVKPEEGVARLLAFGSRHGVRVRLALPTVVRAWDMTPLKGWVEAFVAAHAQQQQQQQQQQQTPPICFEVGNLGAWGLLEEWGVLSSASFPVPSSSPRVDVTTDFTLYSLNSQASAMWARALGASRIALSVEDDKENLKAHMQAWPRAMGAGCAGGAGGAGGTSTVGDESQATVAPQYILYKDVPLFMAEACSLTALHGNTCPGSKVCGYRTLSIENEQGEKFEVAHEHCKSIVYSTNAQSLVHRQKDLLEIGVRDFRLDFLTRKYDKEQFLEVLDAALRREEGDEEALPNTHIANFDRTLL
jgi:putative protease